MIVELSADFRFGDYGTFLRIKDPQWEHVEAAIRLLDQSAHTETTLTLNDEEYMSISGGSGRYFVFIWTKDEVSLQPYDESAPDEQEGIVSGGQGIWSGTRFLLDLDGALTAAKHYFDTGWPSREFIWVET
jgi:hypothetical protein